jgi:hypothetical protein
MSVITYKLGGSVAGAPSGPRAAPARQPLAPDQSATTIGEDGCPAGEARALLLPVAGGGSSDPPAVRGDPPADRGLAGESQRGRGEANMTQGISPSRGVSAGCPRSPILAVPDAGRRQQRPIQRYARARAAQKRSET